MTKGTDSLVSVILPTCNRPDLVKDAVGNVLGQSYENIELIVIDDGPSAEEPLNIGSSDDDRVSILVNDGNQGVSYSRNRGIQEAGGKYIAFIDDDDHWDQEKLRKQVETIESRPSDYCGVYTGARSVRDGKVVEMTDQPIDGDIYPDILVKFFAYPTTSFLLQREAVEAVGGFDESMERGEDWDLTIRLSRRYKFASINEPLVEIGLHDGNVSRNNEHGIISRGNIWRKYESEFHRYPSVRRQFLQIWRRQKSIRGLSSGNRLNALKHAVHNLRHPTILDIGLLLLVPLGKPGYHMARRFRK